MRKGGSAAKRRSMEYIARSDKERVEKLKAHLEGTERVGEAIASRIGKGEGGEG